MQRYEYFSEIVHLIGDFSQGWLFAVKLRQFLFFHINDFRILLWDIFLKRKVSYSFFTFNSIMFYIFVYWKI